MNQKFRKGQVLYALSRDFPQGGFVKLASIIKSEDDEPLWKTDRGVFHERELRRLIASEIGVPVDSSQRRWK